MALRRGDGQVVFEKDRVPWNRGIKTGPLSDEHKRKLRMARLNQVLPTKDTSIEVATQHELDKRGITYETHIPVCGICQPDIVFPSEKVAVQCDGDYWHSKDFKDGLVWERDRHQDKVLRWAGWSVLRFWGSQIRENVKGCVDRIVAEIAMRGVACA